VSAPPAPATVPGYGAPASSPGFAAPPPPPAYTAPAYAPPAYAAPAPTAEPEVTFIPDEPFAEPASARAAAQDTAATVFDEPPLPPVYEPEEVEQPAYVLEEPAADELMDVSPEE